MRAMRAVALTALAAACAPTTEVVSTWKDPAAEGAHFKKMLAVCVCRDAAIRRTVEDQLASRIKGSQAAYTLLSDEQLRDVDASKAIVREAGFDGAVVMMLVNVDRTATYVPGQAYAVPSYYGSMWGGWGYGGTSSTMYDPGYVKEDQYVDFNINVYSVTEDKLLWASRSQTQNPSSVPSMVDEVIAATTQEMKKEKVLK